MKFFRSIRLPENVEFPVLLAVKGALTLGALYLELAVARPAFVRGSGDSMFGLTLTLGLALGINILWRNAIVDFFSSPLTGVLTGGSEPVASRPYYFSAVARRRQGRHGEALAEVRRQLEKFPNDFEGTLLLASIQAENMDDLPGAAHTLEKFCDRPGIPLQLVSVAFTQLADWHIQTADIAAARAAFQKIVERGPDSEAARQAQRRMARLDEAGAIILARHDRQRIVLKPGVQNIGLLDATAFLRPPEADPGQLVTELLGHLEHHPHDADARERLAVIYAKDLKRLELAALELRQLLSAPDQKPGQVAHWLNLLANFQVELGADEAAVRATLEEIAARFPGQPVAEIAQRRLALLNNELRGRRPATLVKLGVYEQNIGLKHGLPRGVRA